MKKEYQEYLKEKFNIDIANLSNGEIEAKLENIIEKNNELIELKQEKNRILEEQLENMLVVE